MKRLAAAVVATALLVPLTAASVHADAKASGPFRIARIHYEQGATLNSEYLVVKNASHHRHNLKGWRIVDPNDGQRYTFPRTVLKAGATVTLHTGRGHNRPGHRYWGQDDPVWNNDGDTALLKKPSGATADRCSYTGLEGGTKIC